MSAWTREVIDYEGGPPAAELVFYEDATREVLSENDSPDLGFRFSLNPYRGCLHGCAYCYARPTHEYWGFGAGSDFERKIIIKRGAAALLRERFEKPSWQGELIVFSGNTDCYQPVEASLGITRACLEVCAEYRNPVHIITKGALVERDLDVLGLLHERASVGVTLSIPFSSDEVARALEPYAPPPSRRFRTMARLASAGIPVGLNIAPVIGGLNDREVAELLESAHAAGATWAGFVPLRLPGNAAPVFVERLREVLPLVAEKVLARTREARGGRLDDARFGHRFEGSGQHLQAVRELFRVTARRLGLKTEEMANARRDSSTFVRPAKAGDQLDFRF